MSILGFNRRRVLNKVSGNVQVSRGVNVPTGGTPYTVNGNQYYVFTGSGTIDASNIDYATTTYNTRSGIITSAILDANVDVLLVAGGGGGGQGAHDCGGGGAGGMVYVENSYVPATSHPISVGGGGGGNGSGGNSQFGTFATAIGGGKGTNDEGPSAGPGGSGGGGGFRPNNWRPANSGAPGVQPTQPGISGQFGHGQPGSPAPTSGNQGGRGGGANPNGATRTVPTDFLPTSGFPSPFLGSPSGNATLYTSFSGGGRGSSLGSSSNIPATYGGRGSGGHAAPAGSYGSAQSGASGVIIVKVRE